MSPNSYQRIIIKIGSNVLTQKDGLPNLSRIKHLVDQLAAIKAQGKELVVVSSGAVAAGRSLLQIDEKLEAVATRQLLASIGQVKLINIYAQLFQEYQLLCSQVLVTKEDFRDRIHYLNMKNCFEILLKHNVIPVVNENDVVSVTELMFTDNDELAGLIASFLNADALIILTNVDGIYDGDPKNGESRVIEEIDSATINIASFISATRSEFGRGGMLTKTDIAQKIASLGISVHIANGQRVNILTDVLEGKVKHTRFIANKKVSGKKKWIAHSEKAAKGVVQINEGAKTMLASGKPVSLLPIGVIGIKADFQKGDIIKLTDQSNESIGWGIANYGSDKARERMGKKQQRPLVHYDYLYLNV